MLKTMGKVFGVILDIVICLALVFGAIKFYPEVKETVLVVDAIIDSAEEAANGHHGIMTLEYKGENIHYFY